MTRKKLGIFILFIFVFVFVVVIFCIGRGDGESALASSVDELKQKIETKTGEISNIEQEIKVYENKVEETQKSANTLKSEVSRIDSGIKKISYDISLTKKKIESTALTVEELQIEIKNKEDEIGNKRVYLGEILRTLNETDSTSLIELFLSQDNFSDFFNDESWQDSFQKEINNNLDELKQLKQVLGEKQNNEKEQKKKFENLKADLQDQKSLEEINKKGKSGLLQETKNKESEYQRILAEKKKLKEAFEKEMMDFESQLRITIDPLSLPAIGSHILNWPLASVYITQFFGNTDFAKTGAYNGAGHNGVDFRAKTPRKCSPWLMV